MSGVKKVLIHQIQQSMTNLEDTLEYFRPDYVFLLSCKFYARDKPALAVMDIEDKNWRSLGDHVKNVEYVELVEIEEAWHKTTMVEVYEVLGDIKKKSQEMAGKDECQFYAGLADAPALMTVGVAFASVMHGMNTYFTRGRRPYYEREYVLEIENLNKITAINNWLESHYTKKRNLRYLREIIRLEDERDSIEQQLREQGIEPSEYEGSNEIFSAKIAENLSPITQKAVDNALRVLEAKDLISIEGKRGRVISSTKLGRLTIKMNPEDLEEENE